MKLERGSRHSHPIVCLQLIDLFAIYLDPEVLAYEFDDLERVGKAWPVLCVPLDKALSHLEADCLDLAARELQLRSGRRRAHVWAKSHLHELHVQEAEGRFGDLSARRGHSPQVLRVLMVGLSQC